MRKPDFFVGLQGARMPSSTLIPFLGGLGSLINPFMQKRAPFLSLGYWAAWGVRFRLVGLGFRVWSLGFRV